MASKNSTREMFVSVRREWKDGSKVEIEFTSVKTVKGETVISNHMVTLYAAGCPDTCTCQGFTRWGHCCHLEHFLLVEGLRTGMAVAAEPVPSITTVVALINLACGKQVVLMGASAIPVPVKDQGQMTKDEISQRDWDRAMEMSPPPLVRSDSLVGNRYRAELPPRGSGPSPIGVSPEWLLRSA